MAKLNLLLLALLVTCALGLVSAQHQARKRFAELERAQSQARELEIEFGRLQLEAGTWSQPARITRIAEEGLRMGPPDARRLRTVTLPAGGAP